MIEQKSKDRKENTYNMTSSDMVTKGTYFPLAFEKEEPSQRRVRDITKGILNFYLKNNISISKLRKLGNVSFGWNDKNGSYQGELSYEKIEEYLKRNRSFDPNVFKLPPILCNWLDSSVEIKLMFHATPNFEDNKGLTFTVPPAFGEHFPLSAAIDREGMAFSSLQLHLQGILIETRNKLVERSDQMFVDNDEWFKNLFLYLNISVALIENTLHQIYYKAKYDSGTMGWSFDEDRIMKIPGGRFTDKFKWIGIITGRPLDDARDEKENVITLKNVRNHFNHFDPPVLGFTIEDVCNWLNYFDDLGMLLWKIRQKIGSPLSKPLITILLAKKVVWRPHDPGTKRIPQSEEVGYSTCCWKNKNHNGTAGRADAGGKEAVG